MAIVHANDQSFRKEIESGLVLVDFWAPWCGPCKMISPVLEQLAAQFGDKVKVVKVNVDENPVSASRFQVMSIPTLLLLKDGKTVDTVIGFRPLPVLAGMVKNHL